MKAAQQATQAVTAQPSEARYQPVTIAHQFRRLPKPIMDMEVGYMVAFYLAPVVKAYIDTHTGEVIPAKKLEGNPDVNNELAPMRRR